MLNKLTNQQISTLRQLWAGNELYEAIRMSSLDICKKSNYYSISAEQLFVEVMFQIDKMKEGTQQWDTLYEDIRQDYHLQDNQIEQDELHLIVATILSIVFYITQSSEWTQYNRMGEELMNQVFRNGTIYKEEIYGLIDNLDNNMGLNDWVDSYLRDNVKWSDQLKEYIEIKEDQQIIYQTNPSIVRKAMTDTKTLPNGHVLYPQTLLKKSSEKIDTTSPSQLAILMEIALRCEVIRTATTPTQFIRALIELRIVEKMSDEKIRSIATQIGTKRKSIQENITQWPSTEQKLAQSIQDILRGK